MITVDRRSFLKLTVFAAAEVVLTACQSKSKAPAQSVAEKAKAEGRDLDSPLEIAKKAIADLPPTYLKQLLEQRVLTFYTEQTLPFTVSRGDYQFPVWDRKLVQTLHDMPDTVQGTFSFREQGTSFPVYRPLSNVDLKYPLVGILTEEDKTRFEQGNIASDGTVFINIGYTPEHVFTDGVTPGIQIMKPRIVSPAKRDEINAYLTFSWVKEFYSLLLDDIGAELAYKKMHSLNFTTMINVQNDKGDIRNAEVIQMLRTSVHNQNGRTKAALDIGGYVLAAKAFEGTQVMSLVEKNKEYANAFSALRNLQLGNSPEQVMLDCYQWINNNPISENFKHEGRMQDLP